MYISHNIHRSRGGEVYMRYGEGLGHVTRLRLHKDNHIQLLAKPGCEAKVIACRELRFIPHNLANTSGPQIRFIIPSKCQSPAHATACF